MACAAGGIAAKCRRRGDREVSGIRRLKVLVGCERSGVIREAFRTLGHDAYSCDLVPAEDGSPFHLKMDVRDALKRGPWDLFIVHPECRFLANSGVLRLYIGGKKP